MTAQNRVSSLSADPQERLARRLYTTRMGRKLLGVLVRPWVSRVGGWLLNRRVSALWIRRFVRRNGIDLAAYEGAPYKSFNAFFTRPIRAGLRPFSAQESDLSAPCDAKVSVYAIDEARRFQIKGTDYTLAKLLKDDRLAQTFGGGWLFVFRLTVDDYHRYAFPVSGRVQPPVKIPGVFHTVNPVAAENAPIYKENTREYTVIRTDDGSVLMMEVGALLVGRIVNHPTGETVRRGDEKGYFEFGGSTVIVAVEPGKWRPADALLQNTADGVETVVKMGETVAYAESLSTVV